MDLRDCVAAPHAAIEDAARYLDAAVTAHLRGNKSLANELIRAADMPEIHSWVCSIWANSASHVRFPNTGPPRIAKELRLKVRMPSRADELRIHERDGYQCRFCSMPVVRPAVRARIRHEYPETARWGDKDAERHAGFMAMWAQYDHVIPHACGGTNDISNVVLACAACNFGRGGYTLEEVAVRDPRAQPLMRRTWDGLERFK